MFKSETEYRRFVCIVFTQNGAFIERKWEIADVECGRHIGPYGDEHITLHLTL